MQLKHLYVFDFDRTLTVNQTNLKYCYDPPNQPEARVGYIKANMKVGIAGMFRAIWAANNVVSIATHCEERKIVVEHLLAIGLSEFEIKKIIIKTWSGGDLRGKNQTNKNNYVKEIVNEVGRQRISGITFVDDSYSNCKDVDEIFIELNIVGNAIFVDNFQKNLGDLNIMPGHEFIEQIIESTSSQKESDLLNLHSQSNSVSRQAPGVEERKISCVML